MMKICIIHTHVHVQYMYMYMNVFYTCMSLVVHLHVFICTLHVALHVYSELFGQYQGMLQVSVDAQICCRKSEQPAQANASSCAMH